MILRFISMIAWSIFFVSGCTQQSSFYVSPTGNDFYPGTEKKPFATIKKAIEEIRQRLKQKQQKNITVFLEDGVYHIQEPLIFSPEDSGEGDFHVIYKALSGKKPIISGGMLLNGWERNDQGLWVSKIPLIQGKPWIFRELFINDKRAQRARHPNRGYLRVAEIGSDNRTNFYYNPGDFPIPENSPEVELVLLHDWSITRINVREIDENQKRITTVDSMGAKSIDFFTIGNWESHPRYFLENSLLFLDEPFEWYRDRETDFIYLMLPDGTHPEQYAIIAPYASNLIAINGSKDNPICNIEFEGIIFSHCAFNLPENGYAGIQACHFDPRDGGTSWQIVPSAIEASWIENCSFNKCTWSHLGGSGLLLGEGSSHSRVINSMFYDISGNGIMIGEGNERLIDQSPWWKSYPGQVASDNHVENCVVSKTGQQFFGAVGIWSGITEKTVLKNNQISDLPYTGISAGWLWSTEPTPCRELRIEGNHIHHIMQKLSDGGGIYTLGLQPEGNIIGNHIHDVEINAGKAESNGMFLDEGTTGMTISGNLIHHIARSPLRFHRATTNLVKDNILVCSDGISPVRYNRTEEKDIHLEKNRILMETNEEDKKILDELIDEWNNK